MKFPRSASRVLCGAAVSLFSAALLPAQQDLMQLTRTLAQQHGVPGCSIALVREGRVVLAAGIGVANRETGEPVTIDTAFNVGSVSKFVAAFGLMRLVEQGKVQLDRPIGDYVARWRLPESEFRTADVNMRRLLSHTAGLSLHGYPGFASAAELPTLEQSLSGATGGRGDVRLVHAPGARCQYSGGGYTLLQLMCEEQTGVGFADYMREHVFEPLAMPRSDYGWTPRVLATAASPHDEAGKPIGVEHFTALAAAGLQTTALDLARIVVLALAEGDEETAGVLRRKTIVDMRRIVPTAERSRRSFGLGMHEMSLAGRPLLGHTGSNTGWEAAVFFHAGSRSGIVLLTNSELGQRVLRPVVAAWAKGLDV